MNSIGKLISIVVPVYNEEANLRLLCDRISSLFEDLDYGWEIILVDDGSYDNSAELMRELNAEDPRVKAIFFSRNFGQSAALTAGLNAASGDAAVIMDADLQDPPELIAEMIKVWHEGYEIIGARRTKRKGETIIKKVTSYFFSRVMNYLVGWSFPKDIGDFRLMDRKVVDALRQCRQSNRFVRSLISWTGFKSTAVDYVRSERHGGRTEYTFWKSLALAITGITSFSVVPLRLATFLGFSIVSLSVAAMIIFVGMRLMGMQGLVPGWTSIVVSIWFLGGIQCLLLGIMGEYVGRTYVEAQSRPIYIVRECLGDMPAFEDTARDEIAGRVNK